MKIAMWSGPRNLSTALMYAFAARGDCEVRDEPFYAAYLSNTGFAHPMAAQITASQPTDPAMVIDELKTEEKDHLYLKLMTHHMLPDVPIDWLSDCVNVFLIRHPARVLASYARKREDPVAADLGFAEQLRLFNAVKEMGQSPVVVDSHDIRANPKMTLTRLCAALGLPWTEQMLVWAHGGNLADGVWAKHWYHEVHRSSGFAGPEGPIPDVSGPLGTVVEALLPIYRELSEETV